MNSITVIRITWTKSEAPHFSISTNVSAATVDTIRAPFGYILARWNLFSYKCVYCCHICITYIQITPSCGILATTVQTILCILEPETRVIIFNKTLISSQWINCVKNCKMPSLRTLIQQNPHVKDTKLPHICIGILIIKVLFEINISMN